MIDSFFSNPLFGIVLTLASYAAGLQIYRRTRASVLHPVITSSIIIIIILQLFNIRLDNYQNGGSIISFLLGPATVSLAVPLFRQIGLLKKHAVVIFIAITAGSISSILSVIFLSGLLGMPDELRISLIPKSITTPIAVELSEKLGGLPSITALAVIFTGITGAVAGPLILKLLKIKHPAAAGLAMGTAAHAIGTSRALEMGEAEGALGSLSISLAGIITVIAAPMFIALF